MKLRGECLFMGCAATPGFKDPSKTNYQAAFADGLDSVKIFISETAYNSLLSIPPFTRVQANFDFNTFNNRLNFSDCVVLGSSASTPASDKKTA